MSPSPRPTKEGRRGSFPLGGVVRTAEQAGGGDETEERASEEEETPPPPPPPPQTDATDTSFLTKKIEVMRKELSDLDQSIVEFNRQRDENWAEWGSQIEKLEAEFATIKKREAAAREAASTTEKVAVLEKIFDQTDNFNFATTFTEPASDAEKIVFERYGRVKQTLADAFDALGVTPIVDVGVAFDPEIHIAAMFVPSEFPSEHVAQVLQQGYKVDNQVVRPATVSVSEGPM